jgi:hypothetical protein
MKRSWRITGAGVAVGLLAAAIGTPAASADATLTFPNDHAICIAQAWVPFNTDPTVAPGSLGVFLSTDPPSDGSFNQREHCD